TAPASTATCWAILGTRPRLWVTNISAKPCRRRLSASRSRTALTVPEYLALVGVGCAGHRVSRYEVLRVGVGAVPERATGTHAWHEITSACTSRTRSRAGSGNQ